MNGIITEQNYPVESIWILKSILGSIIAVVILSPFFLFGLNGGEFSIYMIIYLGFIPFNLVITMLRRVNFHYSIEDKFMTLKQGILSKQQRHIPYGVIQNVYVKQDLFDRLFSLASLTLENASQGGGNQSYGQTKVFGMTVSNRKQERTEMVGFSGNKVSIPGLTKSNAEILKGFVLKKMKENPIDDNQSGL